MKFVSIDSLRAPAGWSKRQREARDDVNGADTTSRADIIKSHSDVWGDLKSSLAGLSSQKCWYCETQWIRDDGEVDHYRPKRPVYGVPNHEGYYWLCFEPRNLIFCCKFCNERRIDREKDYTGGKGSYFPLEDRGVRAFCEADDLINERPLLLDPTDAEDPTLLAFQFDGEAVPSSDASGTRVDARNYLRASTSIELYHLNHTRLVGSRAEVCAQVRSLIVRCDADYRRYLAFDDTGNLDASNIAREAYKQTLRQIKEMLEPRRPHAGAVSSVVRQEAGSPEREWIKTLLAA